MSLPLQSVTQTDDRQRAPLSPQVARVLVLYSAGRMGSEQRLLPAGESLDIGREVAGEPSLSLPLDRKLSRRHARIEFHPQHGLLLRDLGSKNGLSLNGRESPADLSVLSDGDVLRMGATLLLIRKERGAGSALVQDCVPLQRSLRGPSAIMVQLRHALARVARHGHFVLLLGDTGTGKELAAQAVHTLSGRSGKFVAVNCTTLTSSLAESQLFGHERGAFTGAGSAHVGYFREANHGTLFLDEIGDLPRELQPKLLRVLQEKTVRPLGAARDEPVDVRVIAATHIDLQAAAASGQFRDDLLERLAVLPIALPRLAQRREDILPLFVHFLSSSGLPIPSAAELEIPIDLAQRLVLHDWPHNVRELQNACERLRVFCEEPLDLHNIPDELLFPLRPPAPSPQEPGPSRNRSFSRDMTREELLQQLAQSHGSVIQTARRMGVDKGQIYRLAKRYNIDLSTLR